MSFTRPPYNDKNVWVVIEDNSYLARHRNGFVAYLCLTAYESIFKPTYLVVYITVAVKLEPYLYFNYYGSFFHMTMTTYFVVCITIADRLEVSVSEQIQVV